MVSCTQVGQASVVAKPSVPPITSTKLPSLKTYSSPQHYSFILFNVFHLLLESGKNKSKVNYFSELHCDNLMFIALCETYLTNDILDAEVDIPGFSIVRCDRLDRIGGGVCIYVRESLLFEKCLSFSRLTCAWQYFGTFTFELFF